MLIALVGVLITLLYCEDKKENYICTVLRILIDVCASIVLAVQLFEKGGIRSFWNVARQTRLRLWSAC